ncbi:hypothetical protein Tco_0540986 [Tanacetum coccineum]
MLSSNTASLSFCATSSSSSCICSSTVHEVSAIFEGSIDDVFGVGENCVLIPQRNIPMLSRYLPIEDHHNLELHQQDHSEVNSSHKLLDEIDEKLQIQSHMLGATRVNAL